MSQKYFLIKRWIEHDDTIVFLNPNLVGNLDNILSTIREKKKNLQLKINENPHIFKTPGTGKMAGNFTNNIDLICCWIEFNMKVGKLSNLRTRV